MTSKAEEIAKRLVVELAVSARNEPGGYVPVIKAALHEYGALVRARDVEVCREHFGLTQVQGSLVTAAISREPLP